MSLYLANFQGKVDNMILDGKMNDGQDIRGRNITGTL